MASGIFRGCFAFIVFQCVTEHLLDRPSTPRVNVTICDCWYNFSCNYVNVNVAIHWNGLAAGEVCEKGRK